MKFLFPFGLLGLIGVPILILIYIIKNKYTEQTISSTYLWTLSEKFIRRRVPINKLVGILSLILQIIAVILISLGVAHPVLITRGRAFDYCFVLDGSGSMNVLSDGETRFQTAKDKIAEVIDKSTEGSLYTIIYAGDTTSVVLEEEDDKKQAKSILNELQCSSVTENYVDALGEAQKIFDVKPYEKIYLVTDKNYQNTGNIQLLSVAADAENYSVCDVSHEISGSLSVYGGVISYNSAATLTVNLYVDGAEQPAATQSVSVTPLEEKEFAFETELQTFRSYKVEIAERDSLPADNVIEVYNFKSESIADTLLVSDYPIFIRGALISAGNDKVTTVSVSGYQNGVKNGQYLSGYGLYVFDGVNPEVLPSDGAVWFINPRGSVEGTYFGYQGDVEASAPAIYSTSTNTQIRTLTEGLAFPDFTVAKYSKCSLNGRFSTLATCDGNPVIFAGADKYGNREVVFAFDPHDSAPFALRDLDILTSNLLEYSFPSVITESYYECGEMAQINVIAGCVTIKVTYPSGKIIYPDTNVAVSEFGLTEAGTYMVDLTMEGGTERHFSFFAAMAEAERSPVQTGESFVIRGTAENKDLGGTYDVLFIIIIALAVAAVADYGVYCYEQYQLR